MSRNFYWNLLNIDMVDAYGSCIDALTVTNSTAVNRVSARAFLSETAASLATEFYPYEPTKRTKLGRAYGWCRGSVRYANAENYSVLAITGEYTQQAVELVLDWPDPDLKCTRIDLALDLMLRAPFAEFASSVYDKAPSGVAEKMRLVRSSTGETLYRNSRRSATFGRCYDKSLDYGYELGTVWRFEIEVKRVKAQRLLAAIRKSNNVETFVKNVVAKQFRDWHIPMPIVPGETSIPRIELLADVADNRLDWLKSVAPTIRTMAQKNEDEVRSILNLPMFAG